MLADACVLPCSASAGTQHHSYNVMYGSKEAFVGPLRQMQTIAPATTIETNSAAKLVIGKCTMAPRHKDCHKEQRGVKREGIAMSIRLTRRVA